MKSLVTALMICTLTAGAFADKGLINETRTDANGQKTIVIKDYRAKKRALKRTTPSFKEYDLGPSATQLAPDPALQSVNVSYAPSPTSAQQQPQQRVQTYSQTYAPGPNRSMSPGGGGGSFASTVLPTQPYYGYWGNGYYGNYGYGNYGYNGAPWYGYGARCNNYGPAVYPNTYPGFLPGLPSGPPMNLGYPVFNTISPPIIPGFPGGGRGHCR